jgi:hypothetical protein
MTFTRGMVIGLGITLGSALLAGSSILGQDTIKWKVQRQAWFEEDWPFPVDQWGAGRAFECVAVQCGGGVHLYLRAKIGFCRCALGVSDDDEIDRVGDLELVSAKYKPLASGYRVAAGILKGRARLFAVERPLQSSITMLAIALAHKCDAVVATVMGTPDVQAVQEAAALEFLRSEMVQHWAEVNTALE